MQFVIGRERISRVVGCVTLELAPHADSVVPQPITLQSSNAACTPGSQATMRSPYEPSLRSRITSSRNMLAKHEAVETRQPGARAASTSSVMAQPPTTSRRSSMRTRRPPRAR
jgi:hypothetical protein